MTAKERQSLNRLADAFEAFKSQDAQWKQKIENQLAPILKERSEQDILRQFGKHIWKGVVAILGAVAAIGAIVNYLILPFFHIKR